MKWVAHLLTLLVLGLPCTAVRAQSQIPEAKLNAIKQSTVYIKIALGGTSVACGSGFLVKANGGTGYVVTNHHVIDDVRVKLGNLPAGFPRPRLPAGKQTTEVVFNSGNKDEWSAPAEVLLSNVDDDLAVLKFQTTKTLPTPLALDGPSKLPETTSVYVCGFPLGDSLAEGGKNPEISIGQASISSNRTNEKDQVVKVQLNGALNPGNSGGPIVTQEGKFAGVAVQTIRAAGIGFAVPPDLVRDILGVHIRNMKSTTAVVNDTAKHVVSYELLNILGRGKTFQAYYAPAVDAKTPRDVSLLDSSSLVVSKISGEDPAKLTFEFTKPGKLSTTHVWFQTSWIDGNNNVTRLPAFRIDLRRVSADGGLAPMDLGPDKGQAGLKGPDGVDVGLVATRLAAVTYGQMDITELATKSATFVGKEVSVDVLVLGVNPLGFGDGPTLNFRDRNLQSPTGIEFLLDAKLAEQLRQCPVQSPVAVRVKGLVQPPSKSTIWRILAVQEVSFIGLDGKPLATFQRPAASAPTPPKVAVAPSPSPSPSPSRTPPRVESPAPSAKGSTTRRSQFLQSDLGFLNQFRGDGSSTLGRTFQLMFAITAITDESIADGNDTLKVMRLHVNGRSGIEFYKVHLYADATLGEKIRTAFKQDSRKEVIAQIRFKPVRYNEKDWSVDCGVKDISFFDDTGNVRGWTAEGEVISLGEKPRPQVNPVRPQPTPQPNADENVKPAPDPGIGREPPRRADLAPAPEEVAPRQNQPVPQAQPAPIPGNAIKVEAPLAADDDDSTGLIVGGVVGVGILVAAGAGVFFFLKNKANQRTTQRSRNRRSRDADDDEEEDEDDKPRSRRTRDRDEDAPRKRARPVSRDDDEEEDEERPRSRRSSRTARDEDDAPPTRRSSRGRDEDDADERPSRRRPSSRRDDDEDDDRPRSRRPRRDD